ncbi:hypothetical protein [Shewanella sp.]|uniref:hypothetical protein n=1 Tax=Shewanella sp. TaxID=50422 RepID=UPI003566B176
MAFIASAAVASIAHWFEKAIGVGILVCAGIVLLAWWRMNWSEWRYNWCFPDPARIAVQADTQQKPSNEGTVQQKDKHDTDQ